ncbi:hypothetical protein ACFRAU_04990 [Arthrobacter sp. NPDC056691]|uniref:hypothetical protein n=1 Tax=Arthrobacter sp. NPDC056691 TaxID=3345913 RepID=UPI00367181F1
MADQPRAGFPFSSASSGEPSAAPGQVTTTAGSGFPGMSPALPVTALSASETVAHVTRPRAAGTRTTSPRAVAAAPAVSPAVNPGTRRKGGDTLWERVRFEVTDAVTSGALSERLIRASADVEAPITTGRRIVVLGTAGGAGTTTVTAVLAKLLGSIRQESVMAVDATDQSGMLLQRLGTATAAPLSVLIQQFRTQPVRTLPDATANAAACGNQVFAAARTDVRAMADSPVPLAEWTDVSSTLSRFMAVTVVDAGASPLSRHAGALLETAHAVVLVSPPGEERALPGGDRALRLESVRNTLAEAFPNVQQVAVTVHSRQQMHSRLEGRNPAGNLLPFDRHLAGGGALQLSRLGSRTRIAATEAVGRALLAANRA